MTYIEFFDKVSIENICACLTDTPSRVIFIGADSRVMNRYIENYKRIFNDRGHSIEFICKTSPRNNLDKAVSLLTEIVETYDDCVFDIKGGEKIFVLALGIVYERCKHKNIRIHRVNINNNVVNDCDKNGKTVIKAAPCLSVEENIRIYGGDVRYGGITSEAATYVWKVTSEFEDDIEKLWSVCKYNPKGWNIQIGAFDAIGKARRGGGDSLTVTADMRGNHGFNMNPGIVKKLLKAGLLTSFYQDKNTVTVSYKNSQVKKCLTKAGQALEMKIYLTAKNLKDENGNYIYCDAQNGVVIDWDGDGAESKYDTENEIDVMLMHGIVPVFISCKNGRVSIDELYKLNTVAERFGGKYAKKVLVVSSLEMSGDVANHLVQRAADMKITVIDNVARMSDSELSEKLATVWRQ